MKKLTLEERLNILEYKILEKRLNNIEKSLDNRSLKNERGLLRGVIGKVKANGEDAGAIAAILKDKYKIPENLITSEGDKYNFKLYVSFYDKEEQERLLKNVAEKIKNNFVKEMYTYCYTVSLSESDEDKMILELKKATHKYELNPNGSWDYADRDYDYKGKVETLDEVKGLSMASYDKLAKQIVEMMKKNISPNIISNMCDYKEVGKIIYDGLWSINKKYVNSIIDELENNSRFKNVDWGWESKDNSPIIRGQFHINKAGIETGEYNVKIILKDSSIMMYHSRKEMNDLIYRGSLTGNIAKDFDKAVVTCIPNNRGKIESGPFEWSKQDLY